MQKRTFISFISSFFTNKKYNATQNNKNFLLLLSVSNIDNKIYSEVNPELFKLLLQYREFSIKDPIYNSLDITYSDEYNNTKKIILCNDDKSKYCIFTNNHEESYTYDKIIRSDIDALIEGKLIKCLIKTKIS